ncbi:hypothetical protein BH10ACI1_BH10ACI1_27460 [soil metagenome]
MAKKKSEEVEETTDAVETEATAETSPESNDVSAVAIDENAEAKPKKSSSKKKAVEAEEPSVIETVAETVSSAVETVVGVIADGVETVVSAITGNNGNESVKKTHKRAEKIGVVLSDKMTKTVVVRVDRVVKHPVYRKYVKRKKNFMAHDEKGATIGDKVRIIETRPYSARKRWRVIEIIQKAEK